MIVEFKIYGDPKGKGRPRFSSKLGRTYTPAETVKYENLVKLEYKGQNGYWFGDAAIKCNVYVYFAIPKSVSKKVRAKMQSGEVRPTKKPDWDNVGKIICDSLNGVAYVDDKQIVDGGVHKFYCPEWMEQPVTVVIIEDIEEQNHEQMRTP